MSRVKKRKNAQVVIYQAKSGAIELRGDFRAETVWATQAQIANAFDVDVRTVNEHVKNIYRTKELSETPTIRKFRIVQKEGKREITRSVNHYNLDLILSVGYRVNSKNATRFRQWATKTLRQYISTGYVVSKKRLGEHYETFLGMIKDLQIGIPAHSTMNTPLALELVSVFADTWLSLDAYDKDTLRTKGVTKKEVTLTAEMLEKALAEFKDVLMKRGEASELFAQEKQTGAIGGIVGNVMQSFDGKDVYGTVEEKAAHLLYFVVKNHPLNDGNKRSGAYAFVWFLRKARVLDRNRMNTAALTALTLFVAESDPTHKDRIIHLILQLLGK